MVSQAKTTWNEANKEHTKEYQRRYYLEHRESLLAKAKKHQAANREHRKAYLKAYCKRNEDTLKAQYKAYRQANKERINLWHKAHYAANKERIEREQRLYRLAHKEQIRKRNNAYARANREKRRMANRKREALKRGNGHKRYVDSDIFERDNWICGICGRKINKRLKWPNPHAKSIDHIVPITKGGADRATNVQAAHVRCNIGKGAKNIGQLRLKLA